MFVKTEATGFRFIQTFILFLLIAGIHAFSEQVNAQNQGTQKASLTGWENNLRLFIKDRSNNHGGFYYDRGLFRMHTVPMDPEYQLDLFTYRFSYFEDYRWTQSDNGFRSSIGSLNTTNFAVQSQLKNTLELTDRSSLGIVAYQQEDLRAERQLIILSYNHSLSENHHLGIRHTLGSTKTDLDGALFYRAGNRKYGSITAEVTALDWANNVISGLSDSRGSNFDKRHRYKQLPFLYTLRVESPQLWIFRGEAVAAFQPKSSAEVERREQPDQNFILKDWVNYQAALIEANVAGITAGVVLQRTFTRMEREPAGGSEYLLNYGNRQVQQRIGAYFTYSWRGLGIEQWFWTERNRDRQFDENPEEYTAQEPQFTEQGRNLNRYPFDFNEIRRFNKTRIFYEPKGRLLSVFAEHNGDWRSLGRDGHPEIPARNYRNFYPNHILGRNERLTFGIGFRFNEHSKLTLGASLDLDGDMNHGFGWERDNASYSHFDGGFGRLQIVW